MPHTRFIQWSDIATPVAGYAGGIKKQLIEAEELYQELLELWNFAGGTTQSVADQLFEETNGIGNPATPEQVAMVGDLQAAALALHQLYQAMTNVTVAQADRAALFRRIV